MAGPAGRPTSLGCSLASGSPGLDEGLGPRAGVLLSWTGGNDVIDATLVLLASDGDEILTSDPDDLRALAVAAGAHVELIAV
ncbi:MAG: hypothetical protein ACRDYA_06190 [Egibacteraceae bacterium]